ncbi:hypothetical protein CRYUN_Cryun12cG0127000 [Craigia yunnanensis]
MRRGWLSPYDPEFKDSFTKIYTANSLQKEWYIVLGNHDYKGDVQAQLSPILRKIDSRWLCQRSFIVGIGERIFQLHSTEYFVYKAILTGILFFFIMLSELLEIADSFLH